MIGFKAPRSVEPARSRRLESPRGSGRVAEYAPHEWELVRGWLEMGQNTPLAWPTIRLEFNLLHDLKVELDARVLETAETAVPAAVAAA